MSSQLQGRWLICLPLVLREDNKRKETKMENSNYLNILEAVSNASTRLLTAKKECVGVSEPFTYSYNKETKKTFMVMVEKDYLKSITFHLTSTLFNGSNGLVDIKVDEATTNMTATKVAKMFMTYLDDN